MLKSVGPKLVPFMKTVAIHLVLFDGVSTPTLFYCTMKCLPIVSLMFFVLLHGMNFTEAYQYSRRILYGLVACVIGDALLTFNLFEVGMLSFGVGHVCYSLAFGWRPFNIPAVVVCSIIASTIYWFLCDYLSGLVAYLIPIYLFLINVMVWRAIARVQFFDDLWTWTKLCSCIGAITFSVSDLLIAVDKFVLPLPFSHTLIMATYYAAQLGITLSVVDSQVDSVVRMSKKPA